MADRKDRFAKSLAKTQDIKISTTTVAASIRPKTGYNANETRYKTREGKRIARVFRIKALVRYFFNSLSEPKSDRNLQENQSIHSCEQYQLHICQRKMRPWSSCQDYRMWHNKGWGSSFCFHRPTLNKTFLVFKFTSKTTSKIWNKRKFGKLVRQILRNYGEKLDLNLVHRILPKCALRSQKKQFSSNFQTLVFPTMVYITILGTVCDSIVYSHPDVPMDERVHNTLGSTMVHCYWSNWKEVERGLGNMCRRCSFMDKLP